MSKNNKRRPRRKKAMTSFIVIVCLVVSAISAYQFYIANREEAEVEKMPEKERKIAVEKVEKEEQTKETTKETTKEEQIKAEYEEKGFDYEPFENDLTLEEEETEVGQPVELEQAIATYYEITAALKIEQLANIIHPTSEFFMTQYTYLESLKEEGTTVRKHHFQIENMKAARNQTYAVTVKEQYTLKKKSGEQQKVQQINEYIWQQIEGQFYIIEGAVKNKEEE